MPVGGPDSPIIVFWDDIIFRRRDDDSDENNSARRERRDPLVHDQGQEASEMKSAIRSAYKVMKTRFSHP